MRLTTFSKLRSVIEGLGVDYVEVTRQRLELLWKGEIINGRDEVVVSSQGLFEILPDGSVIRVMVHAAQGPYKSRDLPEITMLTDAGTGWHRYHLFWCRTVDQFGNRLRKTNRNDGKFTYPLFWRSGAEYRPELRDGGRNLHLCRNCLQMLGGLGAGINVHSFDVESFLTQSVHAERFSGLSYVSDFDQVPNVYAADWSKISNRFKELRNWTCEKCFTDLSRERRFLHAHHRDHHKGNNSIFNLQALCIACHAGEHPNVSELCGSPELREFRRLFGKRKSGGRDG